MKFGGWNLNKNKMETKELIFNRDDRTTIAEFIFSYETDILIKSDALDLIDVLDNHYLITNEEYLNFTKSITSGTCDIHELNMIVLNKIGDSTIKLIMKEYYGK